MTKNKHHIKHSIDNLFGKIDKKYEILRMYVQKQKRKELSEVSQRELLEMNAELLGLIQLLSELSEDFMWLFDYEDLKEMVTELKKRDEG